MSKQAHEMCIEAGVDFDRLSKAMAANENWGALVHSFEFLTAVSAVLVSWPVCECEEEERDD